MFPNGALMERDALLQSIFTPRDISVYLKGHKKRVAPMQTDPHSRALFNISFGVLSKRALPPGPPRGVPSERDAPFVGLVIHHSKFLVYESPPLLY